MSRRPVLAVVGEGGVLGPDVSELAESLGREAIDAGFRLATGGLGGVMEAASRGAHQSARYVEGDVLGLLPTYDRASANPWVDVVLPTGLGVARNIVLVATADVIVAVGGGSGTLSELAVAWQLGRPIVALRCPGWSGELADRAVDPRRTDTIVGATTASEAIEAAVRLLGLELGP